MTSQLQIGRNFIRALLAFAIGTLGIGGIAWADGENAPESAEPAAAAAPKDAPESDATPQQEAPEGAEATAETPEDAAPAAEPAPVKKTYKAEKKFLLGYVRQCDPHEGTCDWTAQIPLNDYIEKFNSKPRLTIDKGSSLPARKVKKYLDKKAIKKMTDCAVPKSLGKTKSYSSYSGSFTAPGLQETLIPVDLYTCNLVWRYSGTGEWQEPEPFGTYFIILDENGSKKPKFTISPRDVERLETITLTADYSVEGAVDTNNDGVLEVLLNTGISYVLVDFSGGSVSLIADFGPSDDEWIEAAWVDQATDGSVTYQVEGWNIPEMGQYALPNLVTLIRDDDDLDGAVDFLKEVFDGTFEEPLHYAALGASDPIAAAYIKRYKIEVLPTILLRTERLPNRWANKFDETDDGLTFTTKLRESQAIEGEIMNMSKATAEKLIDKHRSMNTVSEHKIIDLPTPEEKAESHRELAQKRFDQEVYLEALRNVQIAWSILPEDEDVLALQQLILNAMIPELENRVKNTEVSVYNIEELESLSGDLKTALAWAWNSDPRLQKLEKTATKNHDKAVKKRDDERKRAEKKAEQEQRRAEKMRRKEEKRQIREEDKMLSKVQTYKKQCISAAKSYSQQDTRLKKAAASGRVNEVKKAQKALEKAQRKFAEAQSNMKRVIQIYHNRGLSDAANAVYSEVRRCL